MHFLNFFLHISETFLVKLGLAAFCGALLGFERRLRRSQIGMKTNFLICIGSMLFTHLGAVLTSGAASGDPTRVMSQIITGVGFLGAGSIFKDAKGPVFGLTSAAIVWVNAAIGSAIGVGFYVEALLLTFTIVVSMPLIHYFEHRYVGPDVFRNILSRGRGGISSPGKSDASSEETAIREIDAEEETHR